MTRVLVSAGDASGDALAAEFVAALRARKPACRVFGMGGSALAAQGVAPRVDSNALAVGGIFELPRSAARIVATWRALSRQLADEQPELVVLVDSGGFHLPFARHVRAHSRAKILYYVAPQVWAWRRGRVRKIAGRVDHVAVLFDFEPAAYEGSGVPVTWVGHPLVDRLRPLRESLDREAARAALGLPASGPGLVLLPGSRRNEIRHQLPVQLEAAAMLRARVPALHVTLALAPSIEDGDLAAAGLPVEALAARGVTLCRGRTHEAIRAADLVLAKPGTVTLEAALLDRPMVVMGRAHPLTAALLRRTLELPSLSMPNLIAGAPIVPEFLQAEATPVRIADALHALLSGAEREQQLRALASVRERLGGGGAADRAAALALRMVDAAPA